MFLHVTIPECVKNFLESSRSPVALIIPARNVPLSARLHRLSLLTPRRNRRHLSEQFGTVTIWSRANSRRRRNSAGVERLQLPTSVCTRSVLAMGLFRLSLKE